MSLETMFRQLLQRWGLEYFGRYYSSYRGFIADNNDPQKAGRLKLRVPAIYGDTVHEYWAYPIGNFAGNKIGLVALPEIGDMVWVEFENGDPRYPLWKYGNFGENDLPDRAKENYPRTTVLVDKAGNTITLDAVNKLIELISAAGTAIEVKDQQINLGTLGGAKEPVLLGDITVEKLEQICDLISNLCTNIAGITVLTPLGPSTPPVNASAFVALKTQVDTLKATLAATKSQIVRTD